ncbi:MAG: FAD-dependent oxidoreductase [Candidatus Eremiobacteraeota bacterium]|nr:FAD-dependent oxidoreductase [Candidatus Eremiobacteraeota bacterium]
MTLHEAGVPATLYEASNRVGGRMHSEAGYWADGQHTEWCGAMIDTKHATMRALAAKFQIPLLDTIAAQRRGARDTAFIEGRYYPMHDADTDFAAIRSVLDRQLAACGDTTTYNRATSEGRRLDNMSMASWIEQYVPGGSKSKLGNLITQAYRNEYGREIGELSALNIVYMLGVQPKYRGPHKEINVLGYSDQRFTTDGGNQRIPEAVAKSLPDGSIKFDQRLTAIRKKPNGIFELRFSAADGGKTTIEADRIILAIPFIVLRGIDYAGAGFDSRKKNAIDNLGYGYHTKLHVQFDRRAWNGPGPWPQPTNGQIWTDLDFQCSTDFSLGQSGASGILEKFTGPPAGMLDTPMEPYAKIDDSPAVKRHVKEFLEKLEHVWPGVARSWNGKATMGNAQADPNTLASYSSWLVGQYTTIAGYEAVRQGQVHFAGEHTSVDFQGFMEGGAKSGVDAAKEVLADYAVRLRANT